MYQIFFKFNLSALLSIYSLKNVDLEFNFQETNF